MRHSTCWPEPVSDFHSDTDNFARPAAVIERPSQKLLLFKEERAENILWIVLAITALWALITGLPN